ncbi:MAG: hypothetical protein WAL50_09185 [Kineosporiaceae bacterium]
MSAARQDLTPGSRAPMGRLAALAVLSEAALVGGYGVYLGVESVIAPATERLAAVVMAVFCAALAVALVVLARALAAGRRWARSPVLVWQVLQASVAAPALSTRWPVGVGLLLLCLLASVGVMRMRPAD